MSITEDLNVPFLDIRAQNQSIWPELQEALDKVIPRAQFILGPAVEQHHGAVARPEVRSRRDGIRVGSEELDRSSPPSFVVVALRWLPWNVGSV